MAINTVRFVSEPTIKNYYTYISDINLIMFDEDFYISHIEMLKKIQYDL